MPDHQPKKAVFILPSLAAGGAERVLITLMNNLDRKRFTPEFISLQQNDGALKNLIADDIIIHDIGSHTKVIWAIIPLFLKLREIKPAIVMSTIAHANFALLLSALFLSYKPRIIVREAITPSFIFETMKLGWLVKLLYKTLYPKADMVISPAQRIIDEFKTFLGTNITHHKLLYNPVNIGLIRALPTKTSDKEINKDRKKTVHFICAGRLHHQKGFDRLIEALPSFQCEYNWKLTILGGGEEHANLTALIQKHNLQDHVILHGFEKKPWPHIGAADCFLLPSRYEGLPNVALESLSVGTPVIATKSAGGIDEIASCANEGDIIITDDMPTFIKAMENIKPTPAALYKASLLPKNFQTKKVVERFMAMLDGREDLRP